MKTMLDLEKEIARLKRRLDQRDGAFSEEESRTVAGITSPDSEKSGFGGMLENRREAAHEKYVADALRWAQKNYDVRDH